MPLLFIYLLPFAFSSLKIYTYLDSVFQSKIIAGSGDLYNEFETICSLGT